jgi:Flp pilus assembly protein TadD
VVFLPACTTSLPNDAQLGGKLSREEVLAGEPFLKGQPMPELPEADILAVNDGMRAFLAETVEGHHQPQMRLRALLRAIITDDTFGLNYNKTTRTAEETFEARTGNCLSFTNMFVAMARELGLPAYFQQVEVPPLWDQQGDTLVLNRHINVYVEAREFQSLTRSSAQVVDFNVADFKSIYRTELISDEMAEAHYYSNIGVEKLQQGELLESFLYLRKGLQKDLEFAPLWTNLGALYSRAGYDRHAEASYLTALRVKNNSLVAASNLVRIYERNGNVEQAALFRDRVERFRARNPYYRYYMARESMDQGDYDAAVKHLRSAIRRKPEEDSFYFLLGVVYLQLGDQEAARNYLEQARSVAADDIMKRRYGSKIRKLLEDYESGLAEA